MTTIYLTATDQLLAVSQKPKIASGDVNSVKVHIDFDSEWNKYTGKTAVFHTTNDATIYEQLILSSECIIPHEVLNKEGTLFIGVRGVSTDGGAVKTSTLVKYKIVKGADTGARTLLVTPDIYQQYIDAMTAGVNPVVNAKIAEWENEVDGFLAEARAFMTGTVLWTNTDETAEFEGCDITGLSLSEFVRFMVMYKHDTDSDSYHSIEVMEKNRAFLLHSTDINGSTIYTDAVGNRRVRVYSDKITFGQGYKNNLNDVHNELCIPCKVVGYKY